MTDKVAGGASAPYPPARQAWYAISLFALVNALDNVDRGIISILIEPIKRDLQLTDTEVSLLVGFAFSFFYAIVGLPMSRFADTGNRKAILSFGIALWSLATAAGSLAKTFPTLFISRGMVGAGEALKGPNAISMISDLVPREKYPRAMSLYQFGISLGSALSLIIGGVLMGIVGGKVFNVLGVEMRDWQLVLLIVGLPGVLVALLVFTTIKEPVRRGRERSDKPPVTEVFRFAWREKAFYLPFLLGAAFLQIEIYGLLQWRIPFYQRTYGWGPEVVGPILGILSIAIVPIGLALGAWLGERMAKKHAGAMILLSIIGTCLSLPLMMLVLLMPTAELALALTTVNYLAMGIGAPASTAALSTVTPNEYRGQVFAAYAFTISVVGTALGPLCVALFTDFVFADEGDIRYAMFATAGIFGAIGLWLKFLCYGPYKRRVEAIIAAENEALG
ncbi:MFS transporter [Alteraurantiacibacter aquimixticola]|uniref:MFS transporter n=1 Tax=Alteraurantiacibacter aquimixticola TaxID=2489173 RepID=A0A4V4U967_9SPHN|nr:MFS transporter [Alteraurantiacibacter aquimixticola]TIX49480.1 MFS transporter [Alteraurantiacibacter aquimixticola]